MVLSRGCLNKSPHSGWLKTAEAHSLAVLETEEQHEGVGRALAPPEVLGENASLSFSLWGLQMLLGL